MNLLRKNNLFDVEDIQKAKNNLLLKNISYQDIGNVLIDDGVMTVDRLKLNFYDRVNDRFLQSSLDDGNITLNIDDTNTIPSWLRYNQKDIKATIFVNDVKAIRYDSICNVCFTNDYDDIAIDKRPYLWDSENMNDYCQISESLNDIYSKDEFYNMLGLSTYSKCNYNSNMTFDDILVGKITFPQMEKMAGILDNTYKNILKLDRIPYTNTIQYGLGLLRDTPLRSTDISSSKYLNSIYSEIYAEYSSKNTEYVKNVNDVIDYINSNQDLFVSFRSNLSDVDSSDVLQLLELSKFKEKVHVHDDHLELSDLAINIYYPSPRNNLKTRKLITKLKNKYINIANPILQDNRNYYVFVHINKQIHAVDFVNIENDIDLSYISTTYSDFPYALNDNYGIIKVNTRLNEINKNDKYSSFSIGLFIDITEEHLTVLDTLVDLVDFEAFLEELASTGEDNGSNLLKFSNNLEEMAPLSFERKKMCYDNLQLQPIVYDPDYNRLFNRPNYLSCFSNDVQFLSLYKNLSEFETDAEKQLVREGLQIGSLGLQNIENVDIYGTNATMGFLTVSNSLIFKLDTPLYFPNDEDNKDKYIFSDDTEGTMKWKKIPEFNVEDVMKTKGIVKMHNKMIYDDNATYTIQLLKNVHDEINNELNKIKDELRAITENEKFLNYLN